jgi:hypothetical protein
MPITALLSFYLLSIIAVSVGELAVGDPFAAHL